MILDALDEIEGDGRVHEMGWVPACTLGSVRLILTSANPAHLSAMQPTTLHMESQPKHILRTIMDDQLKLFAGKVETDCCLAEN